MDALSDVLALLKPRNYLSAGLDAAGDWSLQFPDQGGHIKCGALVSGQCWLSVDGAGEALRLGPGDCFVLGSGRPFRLASDPALPPIDARPLFVDARNGGIVTHQGGGEALLVSSRFALDGRDAELLLRRLPPIVRIDGATSPESLRWPVERTMQELRAPGPGSALVLQHLAHMMLIEALRQYLGRQPGGGEAGWLSALADRQIGAALDAMHGDPARRWTLEDLSRLAGMSRSSFALKFKQRVGSAPLDYLTRWRMRLASERLRETGEPVSAIALALGYESESAFSTAYKRVTGRSPLASRRERMFREVLREAWR